MREQYLALRDHIYMVEALKNSPPIVAE